MAKDPSKTEKATPRRREKAREEGQVARSLDIPISATLLVTFLVLIAYVPFAYTKIVEYFYFIYSSFLKNLPSVSGEEVILVSFKILLILLAPVFIALLATGVFANVIQFGFLFTFKPLQPKLQKINPISGLGRIFSMKTLFELVRNILKLSVASVIAYFLFMKIYTESSNLSFIPVNQQVYLMVEYILMMILFFALLSIPIAVIDFLFRRWEYEENIKMSKHEIKEEQKMYEGNPQIKAAIRRKQRELAMSRMMAEVEKADVVITNPTHFAVALKYDREKDPAPKVVAKGKDKLAQKIKEIAQQHNIPVVEDPPLAQALYKSCEIGDYIPEQFYQVVAKILARVYKQKNIKL